MGKNQENEREFKRQSYFRLLNYAKPYRWRLIIGVTAGLLVGGSLFLAIMLLPQLTQVFDSQQPQNNPAVTVSAATAEEICRQLEQNPNRNQAERIQLVENILAPPEDDPQLAKMLKQLEKAAERYYLPLKVEGYSIHVTWPIEFSLPVKGADDRIAWQLFALYMVGFVLAWTLKNLATYINRYYTRWVGARVVADLRNEVFRSLLNQSLRFYGKMDIGHLISRCSNDTSAIESSVSSVIADATRCPIEILACVAATLVACRQYDNYTLLIILVIGMPMVILPVIILSRKIRKTYKASFAKIAEVISRMHEVFTGILVVKAYNTAEREEQRFRQINRKYFRTIVHALKLQLLMAPLMEVVAVAATLVFLLYAYRSGIKLEQLVALLAPAFLAYEPIKNLSKVIPELQKSMAAADRYFDLIDTHTALSEKADAVELQNFNDRISFQHVEFAYADHKILDDISFDIPKGSVVAVVGETGSGKTTIANLIARFYDVDRGSVTIDGVDVRDFSLASLRRHIGIVTQDAILFNDTIANNIAYGCPNASPEAIVEAAKQANAHQFIVDGHHTEGYDTEVGEKGFKLSGGEKQRVAIARAILKNPPILILDEATSALDTVTERLVQDALNRVMSNRTVFAIAHRLSTIQNADLIIVLKDGKIIERGTHAELLALDGVYKQLHTTQFGGN
ncbi:ABC transporter ATP-binding protein [Victivallis sp. Marseille-Q1083]|uniref:ABC transporter ATP-binding protein n=1 Tax=Victivallis sp. Marseille-Q1083 TaxID=2717288 RepID=UPI00158B9946|nr:ABC transporter ATP-binding protein [Victivallis sp. Marseille-Q1083]